MALPYILQSAPFLGDNATEGNRQPLSGIPEQSDVYRDSVQTDDLHRAIQYLDEDACGSLRGFVFHPREERVITRFPAAIHEEPTIPNKNCIVPCRVALFTERRISKTVRPCIACKRRRLEIRGYAGITLERNSLFTLLLGEFPASA